MTLQPDDRPVFHLQIDAAGCRFDLRVNDVPIFDNPDTLPFDVALPINEWLVAGENVLAALVQPPPVFSDDGDELYAEEDYDENESWLKLTLYVKESGAERANRKKVASLHFVAADARPPGNGTESSSDPGTFSSADGFAPDPGGDVSVSPVELVVDEEIQATLVARAITLPGPFPPWVWLSGEPVADEDATREALLGEYRKVWELLSAVDVEAVERLFETRAAEVGGAYWLEGTEVRDAMSVFDLMQSEELTLQPLDEEVELEIFAGGRLARLVDANGDPPIVWTNRDEVGYYLSLTYCRAGGAWLLVR